jgi:hypothetical protein
MNGAFSPTIVYTDSSKIVSATRVCVAKNEKVLKTLFFFFVKWFYQIAKRDKIDKNQCLNYNMNGLKVNTNFENQDIKIV